jgi:hypothetical protein
MKGSIFCCPDPDGQDGEVRKCILLYFSQMKIGVFKYFHAPELPVKRDDLLGTTEAFVSCANPNPQAVKNEGGSPSNSPFFTVWKISIYMLFSCHTRTPRLKSLLFCGKSDKWWIIKSISLLCESLKT